MKRGNVNSALGDYIHRKMMQDISDGRVSSDLFKILKELIDTLEDTMVYWQDKQYMYDMQTVIELLLDLRLDQAISFKQRILEERINA